MTWRVARLKNGKYFRKKILHDGVLQYSDLMLTASIGRDVHTLVRLFCAIIKRVPAWEDRKRLLVAENPRRVITNFSIFSA